MIKHLFIAPFILFGSASLVCAEALDLPREVTIYHLGDKGDRLRVFSEPKVHIIRRDRVDVDKNDRAGEADPTATFEITALQKDPPGKLLEVLRPFGVEPLTRYRLSWAQKLDSITGDAPAFAMECEDLNFDPITEWLVPIPSSDAKGIWVRHSHEFCTLPQMHHLRLAFGSAKGGAAHLRLDQIYLEQISEPGACRPTPITVAADITPELQGVTYALPENRRAMTLSAEILWQAWDGSCEIEFQWLDKDAHVVGSHACRIAVMRGVLPRWNGITVDWIGQMQRPTDPISERRTEHLDATKAKVDFTLLLPSSVSAVRVSRKENLKSGSIQVNHVGICAEVPPEPGS